MQLQEHPTDAVEQFRTEEPASPEHDSKATTPRELADRWTYYFQSPHMSPAELKAWLHAKQRTTPPRSGWPG
jgi:hypothetical protein